MSGLWLALSFLTTLPLVSARYRYQEQHWQTAVFWFPVVGGMVGGVVWLVGWGGSQFFSSWMAAMLAVAAWVVITGGLHLDGLADCCDGLLAAAAPERRLTIMRDPRVGAFGAVGLILFLGLKVGAVQGVLAAGRGAAVVAAAALGRTLILWVARQPAARPEGMGAMFRRQIRPLALIVTTLLAVVGVGVWGWRGWLAAAAAALMGMGIVGLARQRIGGVTGDVLGLTVEVVELSVLLVFAGQVSG